MKRNIISAGVGLGIVGLLVVSLISPRIASGIGIIDNDFIAPVITEVAAGSVTSLGATITWLTNEAANSNVQYGTTDAYGTETVADSNYVTSHSVVLMGLLPETTYHFRVISSDSSENAGVSADATFTTSEKPQPKIYTRCLVTAIQKRDRAVKDNWDAFAPVVSNAFQTRMEALSNAHYLATSAERTAAIKAAWRAFRKSRKDARKAYNMARFNAWKTFHTERKTCKAPIDTYGSGIDTEPVHSD